jgi:DNA primase
MQGCLDAFIESAGLARRSRHGTLTDSFRNRAILPVRSGNGTVIGFIGRSPDHTQPGVPKYINSRRTCLYDKSAALFGCTVGASIADASLRQRMAQVQAPTGICLPTGGHHLGISP